MSNPAGSSGVGSPEDRNEFIEVFNKGSDAIDLSGWQITDFDDIDEIIPFYILSGDSNTILSPGEFALIMDPEYIDSGDNYMPYGIPSCLLLTVGNTTIGNELSPKDPIALISPSGDTVSTYYHPFDAGDGISVERVYPYSGDIPENWRACEDITGSTPGRENSVYSAPDFFLDSIWVEENNVSVLLLNPYDAMLSGTIEVFDDENRNRVLDEGELIEIFTLTDIPQDSSIRLTFSLSAEDVYLIGFDLIGEIIFRRVRIGNGIAELIVNEIMYAPLSDGPPEWIELFNRSQYGFSLDSFRIENITAAGTEVLAGGYLIVTSDSADFLGYYGSISSPVLEMNLSFSNDGDSIFLLDENGFLLDYVVYSGGAAERNYSLERVNTDLPAITLTNWGQSIPEGGTPGALNSLFAEYKRTEIALDVNPKHFTPDGDGVDERCVVSFNLPYLRSEVTLRIYDRRGHLLRENSDIYGGEQGVWIWDGKCNSDETVSTGLYIVFALIKDADGSSRSIEKTVVSVGR
jgi:hypothetical protein